MTTTALLETLITTELPLAEHSQLIGAVLEGQEGASATVKVNGVAATYPITLTESDTLRIERPVGEVVTRLYGQPGPNAGTGPKGDTGPAGPAATVTVGTVTTGAPGTQAQVTNSGTTSAAVLNFTIPKGADGAGGSGAVSSVAGRTGDVTLAKADVGLGNVTNDAQVKRSEMGVASGVATLGADGKVPAAQLPAGAGGTMDAETVQDIVGAMVKAGSNTTITYDDAAGTLTIGTGDSGEAGSLAYLRTTAGSSFWSTDAGVGTGSGPDAVARYTVLQPIVIRYLLFPSGGYPRYDGEIYILRDASGNELGQGVLESRTIDGYGKSAELNPPITLLPGTSFSLSGEFSNGWNMAAQAWPGTPSTDGRLRFESGTTWAPNIVFSSGDLTKSVVGPLDPVDFPISTTAAAPNKSGFMVVDDTAKTASLYWKFSDGTTKKLDLT